MSKSKPVNSELIFSIGVSIFELITVLILVLYPAVLMEDSYWRKSLIGSLFTLICIGGTLAVFYPKKCSEKLSIPKINRVKSSTTGNDDSTAINGHHPDCGKFSAHVIHVKSRALCAACTGLLIGAFIAVAGAALYFFAEWNIGHTGPLFVWAGQAGIFFGFIQFKFKGYARLAVNAFFVVGAFLILAGIDAVVENISVDLFLIGSIGSWLLTRILISKWNNWRICSTCNICEKEKKIN